MPALDDMASGARIREAVSAALSGIDLDVRAAVGRLDDPYLNAVLAAARLLGDAAAAEQQGRPHPPAGSHLAAAEVIHSPLTDWCACLPEGADRCWYRLLADAVIAHLDVRDGDEAEVALCVDAVERATQPCLTDSELFHLAEARCALDRWDIGNGPEIYGKERTLADQLRNMLALIDRMAPDMAEQG